MTTSKTSPQAGLAGKHKGFIPLIAAMEQAEGAIGEARATPLRVSVGGVHESLAHELIPHAIGEGRTVFPVLRKVTGSSEAATAMTRDHRRIAALTDELERIRDDVARSGLDSDRERSLGRVLHDLRDVLQRHFHEEEEVCFKVLTAELSPEQAREMCDAMERSAAEIRSLYE